MRTTRETDPQNCGKLTRRSAEISFCHDGVAGFLRAVHRRDTAAAVAAETGISHRTVERWLDPGEAVAPSSVHLLILVGCYGPELLAAAMGDQAPGWLCAAERRKRLDEIDDRIAELAAQRAALEA